MRAVTLAGQKLHVNCLGSKTQFLNLLGREQKTVEYKHIGNVDDVTMCFDMPTKHTVNTKDINDVRIITLVKNRAALQWLFRTCERKYFAIYRNF